MANKTEVGGASRLGRRSKAERRHEAVPIVHEDRRSGEERRSGRDRRTDPR